MQLKKQIRFSWFDTIRSSNEVKPVKLLPLRRLLQWKTFFKLKSLFYMVYGKHLHSKKVKNVVLLVIRNLEIKKSNLS